ncbi:MAG: hypothetical protein H6Q03_2787 [Acidobacteria bacterium]|nr:hypothetical protein [Acidobacteriota bacterium]
MESRPLRLALAALALFGIGLDARRALATTLNPVSDAALVDRAPVILIGQIEGRLPNTTDAAVTDWLVTAERVLKGTVSDGALVLRVPGGEAPDGSILHLYGAPAFRPGERALLFLAPRPDRTWRVYQFGQGAFHGARADGRLFAAQNLSEVRVVTGTLRDRRAPRELRDFDAFAAWIEDRVAGLERDPDYLVRPSRAGLRAITDEFTLLSWNGMNARWFEFDGGGTVSFRTSGVQAGLPGGGAAELTRALAAWNAERKTPVLLGNAGTTDATAGFLRRDGVNAVLFGDPNGEVEELDCQGAGYLAIGGWRTEGGTGYFKEANYHRISEGDVIVNNGLDCYLSRARNPSKYIERLLAHEIGHTLGIGHSSENWYEPRAVLRNALMFGGGLSSSDARGGQLNSDDIAALQALYQPPKPLPPGACPANTLCLLGGRFEVTATWQNQFDNSSGVAGAIRASDVAGYLYFTDRNNYELIFKILDFGGTIKVFYGQLTNLHFTISVKDKRTGAVKTYSNTPGDCGGLDENGFTAGAVIGDFARARSRRGRAGVRGTCRPDADTMCLLNDRFALEMRWRNQYDGSSGAGLPKRLTNLTGAFGFTSTANLELLVKTLDFGDRILVLYGALSNLEYELRVTDTLTARTKTYFNPAGQFCGGLDNDF